RAVQGPRRRAGIHTAPGIFGAEHSAGVVADGLLAADLVSIQFADEIPVALGLDGDGVAVALPLHAASPWQALLPGVHVLIRPTCQTRRRVRNRYASRQ